jgi:hypothetical protein
MARDITAAAIDAGLDQKVQERQPMWKADSREK